jgi:hypothetical protein
MTRLPCHANPAAGGRPGKPERFRHGCRRIASSPASSSAVSLTPWHRERVPRHRALLSSHHRSSPSMSHLDPGAPAECSSVDDGSPVLKEGIGYPVITRKRLFRPSTWEAQQTSSEPKRGLSPAGRCSDLGNRRVQPVTAARVRCVGATSFPKFHDCGGASGRAQTARLDAVRVFGTGVGCRRSCDHVLCELPVALGAPDSPADH